MNERQEFFVEEHLVEIIVDHRHRTAVEIMEAILAGAKKTGVEQINLML